ncbi:unnamed protein product [Parnassius apollo]|uniref:(apollo) hypothetical protein n=1 Tax=Parnassius apollo TaxID=110799 RepID=A0A8S3XSC6_PARAO|nr:unnamed protein product [Parnassius apollo]
MHSKVLLSVAFSRLRDTLETEGNWLDMTLACPATPSWYLRRIAWRETPPLLGLSRQFNTGLRAELHIGNRPIFVFKVPPAIRSQDMMRLF